MNTGLVLKLMYGLCSLYQGCLKSYLILDSNADYEAPPPICKDYTAFNFYDVWI